MSFWNTFTPQLTSGATDKSKASDGNSSRSKRKSKSKSQKEANRFGSVDYKVLPSTSSQQFDNNYPSGSDSESDYSDGGDTNDTTIMVAHGNYDIRQGFESSHEGLVYSARKIRNIRIILSIILITVIGALITAAVILLVNAGSEDLSDSKDTRARLALPDILSGKFSPVRQNMTWSGCDTVTYYEGNKKVELNVIDKTKKVLTDINRSRIPHTRSADGKYLLLTEESERIFRYSFSAKYHILDLETKIVTPIKIRENVERLVLVKWGPIGNSLIINFRGNLYYKKSVLDTEIALTDDASINKRILNGIADWVYEEEVLSGSEAVWFNPSGTQLAFIKFDDSPTHVVNIQLYGEPNDIRYQYPLHKPVAYPKSGSFNPIVSAYVIDLVRVVEEGQITNDAMSRVPAPSALNTEEHIITVMEWLNDDNLYSVWMNRIQNESYIQVTNKRRRLETFSIKSKTGWVDLFTPPLKNKNGSQVALILPQSQGKKDGDYRHLSLLSTTETFQKSYALTSGKYVVQSLLKWDADTNLIFFMANTPERSHSMHLYAIKAVKKSGGEKPQCLTCNLIKFNDSEQTYFSADFSECGKNIIINSLGPNPPSVHIFQWSYNSGNVILTKLMDWELNTRLRSMLQNVAVPKTDILTFDIEDGFTAKVLLQLPPNLDKSKKYPMLVDVYGGPDSFAVTDKWSLDWGSYLASNRSIVYAKIDGRGSGLRGDRLLHSIYKKLGTYEVYDQINVTRKLQQTLPFIDAEHTGIWGWSYGGYVSGRALALDDNKIFQCATSVAPVTDWLYYDSIYTERYLQTPEMNPSGYAESSLTNIAKKFDNKKYLIIHGTFDDNVHYQQSLMLIKSLERSNILFKQISYPDEDHSLSNVRQHLYHSLDRFFGACFGLENSKFFR